MAEFIGYVKGQRSDVHRIGGKASGLAVTANGWNYGGKVILTHHKNENHISIHLTAGSNGQYLSIPVLSLSETEAINLLSGKTEIKISIKNRGKK